MASIEELEARIKKLEEQVARLTRTIDDPTRFSTKAPDPYQGSFPLPPSPPYSPPPLGHPLPFPWSA